MKLVVDRQFNLPMLVEKVFDYLSDHTNYADWYPGVISVSKRINDEQIGVGTIFDEVIRLPTGGETTIEITVVEHDARRRFVTEGNFKPLFPRMEFDFCSEPSGGTQVRWRFLTRNPSWIGRNAMALLLGRRLRVNADKAIENLKST